MRTLFFYPANFSNLRRGTPIRFHSLYIHLKKIDEVQLLARKIPSCSDSDMHEIGQGMKGLNWWKTHKALRSMIQEFKPDVLFGCTHRSILPLLLARPKGMPVCIDIHGLCEERENVSAFTKWWKEYWFNFLLRHVNGITAPCTPLINRYEKIVKEKKIIEGGVRLDSIRDATKEKLAKNENPTIIYCGNLSHYQGIEYLLEALAMILEKEWNFVLICSSEQEKAQRLLEKYNLIHRTVLLFNIPQERVFSILKGCDIAVVPRPDIPVTRYAFPSKLAECLAADIAVIATDVSDAKIIVIPNKTGWLVEPGKSNKIAEALTDALDHPEKRKEYRINAKKLIEKRYDWKDIVAKLHTFLYSLTQ
jgi:glycosyltransferase involved in cell wall biosynthesis